MNVKVEECYSGGDRFFFRCSGDFRRTGDEVKCFRVYGDRWTRSVAAEALDFLVREYGVNRKSVKFIHH